MTFSGLILETDIYAVRCSLFLGRFLLFIGIELRNTYISIGLFPINMVFSLPHNFWTKNVIFEQKGPNSFGLELSLTKCKQLFEAFKNITCLDWYEQEK